MSSPRCKVLSPACLRVCRRSLRRSNQPAIAQAKRIERPPFLIAASDIAMIDGDWKLIEWNAGTLSLFNLGKDISETNDLYGKEAERARVLTAKLENNPAISTDIGA